MTKTEIIEEDCSKPCSKFLFSSLDGIEVRDHFNKQQSEKRHSSLSTHYIHFL